MAHMFYMCCTILYGHPADSVAMKRQNFDTNLAQHDIQPLSCQSLPQW